MNHETRAAANRLQHAWSGTRKIDRSGALRFDYIADLAAVADAFLAEHPADDDEPITMEWLKLAGFSHLDARYGPECLDRNGLNTWKGNDEGDWQFRFGLACLNRNRSFETRGDVRRLCAALGIALENEQ